MSNVHKVDFTATGSRDYWQGFSDGQESGLRMAPDRHRIQGFWVGVATCAVVAVVTCLIVWVSL